MIYAKDHKTCGMFDPFSHLGLKRLKMLTDSCPELFRQELLPNLPVHLLSKYYKRELMSKHSLEEAVFHAVTTHLAKVFSVDMGKQRLDSIYIFSNMKYLGRIGLFIRTNKGFLTNLKRNHKQLYAALDEELVGRYMSKKGESAFAMVKPSDSSKRLSELGDDLFLLVEQFKDDEAVTATRGRVIRPR